jgi:hypothetical protein
MSCSEDNLLAGGDSDYWARVHDLHRLDLLSLSADAAKVLSC